jgi:hypothetical protein
MRKISTGEDSTLKTYRCMAVVLAGEGSLAVKFIDGKIETSPNRENEEVIAEESQMLCLIGDLARAEREIKEVQKEVEDVQKEMSQPWELRKKFNRIVNRMIETEKYYIHIPHGARVYFLTHIGAIIKNGTPLARIENSKGKTVHNMDYPFPDNKFGEVLDIRQVYQNANKRLLIEFEVIG